MNEVNAGESFMPEIDDDEMEVEHLLAEPKSDHVSVDGVFGLEKNNHNKGLEINDEPCEYQKLDNGLLDSNTILEGDDKKMEVFEKLMPEVERVENSHAKNGLSTACEDYLLDVEFAEKDPYSDYVPGGGSSLDNSGLENHSPGYSGSTNGAVGISESSSDSVPVPKCKNGTHGKTAMCELHHTVITECGCQQNVMEKAELNSPTSFDSQYLDQLGNMSNCLARDTTSKENKMTVLPSPVWISGEKHKSRNPRFKKASSVGQGIERKSYVTWDLSTNNSDEASRNGLFSNPKRLRKPTKRYIEEFSDLKSKQLKGKQKSMTTSKIKHLGVRSCNEHDTKGFRRLKLVPREDSYGGSTFQSSSEFRMRKGYPKKYASISELDSDEEPNLDESEDDAPPKKRSKKSGDRRKQQRMWALPEVIKLVDGVSHYGVGRWTDIKRLFFSSTAYRTPIDLRDKWRNLLRASNAWLHSDREDEQKPKYTSRLLPKTVLHRVSELASIYPYPGHRNSKYSHKAHVSPPVPPNNSVPFNISTRRKSFS